MHQVVSSCRRGRTPMAALLAGTLALAAVTPSLAWAQEADDPTEQVEDGGAEDGAGAQDPDGSGGEAPDGEEGSTGGEQPEVTDPTDEDDGEGPAAPAAPGVTCDAEADEDDGEVYYWLEPGEHVTCVAEGLDPAVDAEWGIEVYSVTLADLDDDEAFDEPTEVLGETVTPTADGTITFDFTVAADVLIGEYLGFVAQGEPGDETYFEEFYAIALGDLDFTIGDLDCPDPVVAGATETCTAADLEAGEFVWGVQFLSVRDLIDEMNDLDDLLTEFEEGDESDLDDLDLLLGEPDVEGTGVVGEDGVASFAFDVPGNRSLDLYIAVAFQESGYLAVTLGEVTGADEPIVNGPERTPTTTSPPTPVAVPRPNRVEAGAGGAATDGAAGLVALAGLVGVGGLLLHRRLATR